MSLCPSCAHQEDSWQHKASCQSVEAKLPPSLRGVGGQPRRLEEEVVTRAPRVRKPAPAVTENAPTTVTENPTVTKNRGRPKKDEPLTPAERARRARERKKDEAKVEDV